MQLAAMRMGGAMRRYFAAWSCLWILAVGAAAPAAPARAQYVEPLSAFPQSVLSIRTAAGKVINFKIWTADTPRREEQGLMFVHEMDEHAGMLFVFPGSKRVSMWMKNTYIPLDLLFMNRFGKIDYIAARATPLSEAIIGPSDPEFAVLELNGGAATRLGIKVGDFALHPSFQHPN
jgi:uncharacterized membrane protein (UPF0127 family)